MSRLEQYVFVPINLNTATPEKVPPAKVDRSGLRISFDAGCDEGLFFAAERTFFAAIFFRLDGFRGGFASFSHVYS